MAAVAMATGLGVAVFLGHAGLFCGLCAGELGLDGVGGNVAQLLRSIDCRVCIGAARQQRQPDNQEVTNKTFHGPYANSRESPRAAQGMRLGRRLDKKWNFFSMEQVILFSVWLVVLRNRFARWRAWATAAFSAAPFKFL